MRLFVALEVPPEIRQTVDKRTLDVRSELPKARWVRRDAMHLTLVFLGEIEEGRLPDLHRELGAAFAAHPEMELRIEGLGAFPSRGRRRTVWVGAHADGDLEGLQGRVADAVERATEVEPDRRPYMPHLTLARCKPPWPVVAVERLAVAFGSKPVGAFRVHRGSLMASELYRSGPRYRTVETYALEKAR